MTTYQIELWSEVWPEIRYIAPAHYAEVQIDGGVYVDTLLADEKNGSLICFTARESGGLVGYWWGKVFRNSLIRGDLCAFNQAIYVLPEFRNEGIGKNMIYHVEKSLKDMGVAFIYISSREKKDITPILSHLGYEKAEVIMEKRL